MPNCQPVEPGPDGVTSTDDLCIECLTLKAKVAELEAMRGLAIATIDRQAKELERAERQRDRIRQRDRLVELAIDIADSIAIVTHTGEADGIVRNHISQNIAKLTAYLKKENLKLEKSDE